MGAGPVTPLTPAETAAKEASALREGYPIRAAIAFDDLVNVLTDGTPDETISSRMGRWALDDAGWKKDVGTAVCGALGLLQHNHDAQAVAGDAARAEQVAQIEQSSGIIDQ